MDTDTFFHAGGPISANADCYMTRTCEQSVLNAIFPLNLQQRQYVSILGSRQVGKTSLLARVKTVLDKQKIPNAYVDLSPFQRLESAVWYNQVAMQLHRQFQERSVDQEAYDSLSFKLFLNSLEVVSTPNKWAVIMFDEVASVSPEIRNDFFSVLRQLYASRLFEPTPATRFIFLFAGSFYPGALITNQDNSPFNVSKEVEVLDFERNELEQLLTKGAQILGLHFQKKAVDEIWDAARGHPFLTQKICQDLVRYAKHVIGPSDVKVVVNDLINTSNHTHLRSIVGYLKDSPKYTRLLRDVVVGRKKIMMHRVENTGIERIGVLVGDSKDGFARVRNRIYERYLYSYLIDASWPEEGVSSQLPAEEPIEKPTQAVEIFYSYSHQDKDLREKLEKHLSSLQREHLIIGCHDRRITAGQEWKGEIDSHLNMAQVILLLISPDFIASEYCLDVEVKQAMMRHEQKKACVIPIILRPVDWQKTPFGKLLALPEDAKPITLWQNQDEAFFEVVKSIRKVVEYMSIKL